MSAVWQSTGTYTKLIWFYLFCKCTFYQKPCCFQPISATTSVRSTDTCNCLKSASVMSHENCCNYFFAGIRQFRPLLSMVLSLMLISNSTILLHVNVIICRGSNRFNKRWLHRKLGVLVCLECRDENRPFPGSSIRPNLVIIRH